MPWDLQIRATEEDPFGSEDNVKGILKHAFPEIHFEVSPTEPYQATVTKHDFSSGREVVTEEIETFNPILLAEIYGGRAFLNLQINFEESGCICAEVRGSSRQAIELFKHLEDVTNWKVFDPGAGALFPDLAERILKNIEEDE